MQGNNLAALSDEFPIMHRFQADGCVMLETRREEPQDGATHGTLPAQLHLAHVGGGACREGGVVRGL